MKLVFYYSIVIIMVFTSCYPTRYIPPGDGKFQQFQSQNDIITRSLFDDHGSTISEENIQKLLGGEIKISDNAKLAIFEYGGSRNIGFYSNHEDHLKSRQNYIDSLASVLLNNHKIGEVVFLPKIIIPKHPNITQLRESAVRLQADLLLIFSINSDVYHKYKFLKKNEAKAFATCETLLLDTRTGVIPYSVIVTKDKMIVKTEKDFNNEVMHRRAENEAVLMTIIESGKRVSKYVKDK